MYETPKWGFDVAATGPNWYLTCQDNYNMSSLQETQQSNWVVFPHSYWPLTSLDILHSLIALLKWNGLVEMLTKHLHSFDVHQRIYLIEPEYWDASVHPLPLIRWLTEPSRLLHPVIVTLRTPTEHLRSQPIASLSLQAGRRALLLTFSRNYKFSAIQ